MIFRAPNLRSAGHCGDYNISSVLAQGLVQAVRPRLHCILAWRPVKEDLVNTTEWDTI